MSSDAACALLTAIVCMRDRQLQTASLGALTSASDRLERFKAGEAYQALKKRPA